MADKLQMTFTGGELAPQAHGRVDLAKFQSGAKTLRNFYVHPIGGVVNRPGTVFVNYTKDQDTPVREIPFEYNSEQQYVLEFGNEYFRIKYRGAYVTDPDKAIGNLAFVIESPPSNRKFLGTFTMSGHGFSSGDWIVLSGIENGNEINGRTVVVVALSPITFSVTDLDGNPIELFDEELPDTNSGSVSRITTVATPYVRNDEFDDLSKLNFAQSGDVMTVCVGGRWWPREIVRGSEGHHDFSIACLEIRPKIDAPVIKWVTQNYKWRIDAVNVSNGVYADSHWLAFDTVRNAPFHNIQIGSKIYIDGVEDQDDRPGDVPPYVSDIARHINRRFYIVREKVPGSPNSLIGLADLDGNPIDTSGWLGRSKGYSGRVTQNTPLRFKVTAVNKEGEESLSSAYGEYTHFIDDLPDSKYFAEVKLVPPEDSEEIDHYNFYRMKRGIYGFVGTWEDHHYFAQNVEPDLVDVAPAEEPDNPFVELLDEIEIDSVTSNGQTLITTKLEHGYGDKDVVQVDGCHRFRGNIDTITKANPAVISFVDDGHDLAAGDKVYITGVVGMDEVNGKTFTILKDWRVPGDHEFILNDGHRQEVWTADPNYTMYQSGGKAYTYMADINKTFYQVNRSAGDDLKQFYLKDFDGSDVEIEHFSSYESNETDPAPGYVQRCDSAHFPGVVTFHEQRRMFARSDKYRQRVWGSQIGNIYNMNQTKPPKADDAISFDLIATRANEIRHMISMQKMFIFTSGAEWVSFAGDDGYTIENIRNRTHSSNGAAAHPRPLQIGHTVLYVQELGNSIWDMRYSFDADTYGGHSRSILSEHLFEGKQIVDWAYQHVPKHIVWVVLNDGTLAAMTYIPEQEIWGWSRHDTDGEVETVTAVNEGSESVIYITVKRMIDGKERRMSERLHTRTFTDVRDCHFVDSGLEHDEPVAISTVSHSSPCVVTTSVPHGLADGDRVDLSDIEGMTELNNEQYVAANVKTTENSFSLMSVYTGAHRIITGISQSSPAVVDSAGHGFSGGEYIKIVNVTGMTAINDRYFIVEIIGGNSDQFKLKNLDGEDFDTSGYLSYGADGRTELATPIDSKNFEPYTENGNLRRAISELYGLTHLEGKTVSILANGNVESPQVVTNGTITLPSGPAGRIHVGLPYVSQMESLELTDSEGRLSGRLKSVARAILRLYRTRSLYAGPNLEQLTLLKEREFENYSEPTNFQTGEFNLVLDSEWSYAGGIAVQQSDPLPVTIQSVGFDLDISNI
jgi:hypothetical protein